MNLADSFLLGFIVMASLTAATFFLKFWRRTADILFAAFAAFFSIEAAIRISLFFFAKPNEAKPAVYIIRLIAFILVLAAIVRKNFGKGA
jgi:uncharacterized membrane protein HdeD (DUF308 family)